MKILWIKTDFLHPTTKGGHIRTLEILKRLHNRHEIHYVAFETLGQPEGLARSSQYCSRAYPVPNRVVERNSLRFLGQLAVGLFSRVPVSVSRYQSRRMEKVVGDLIDSGGFDRVVCDFLTPSINIPRMSRVSIFQHNVETAIWRRHARYALDPVRRFYFALQARRMLCYERDVCRNAAHVIAVSAEDARLMSALFGVTKLSVVPTGVDVGFFSPRGAGPRVADLVFLGSMDWLPNIDGVRYFVRDVLPLIRQRRPGCSLVIAGRKPDRKIRALASLDSGILVTGTVPDVRPYLWGSWVSVVPLRIGGGTRLKIYESMAAGVPVVSTSVGAEGLEVSSPRNIRIADDPREFAERCLELLENPEERDLLAAAGRDFVATKHSWDYAADCFESILESAIK